MPEIKLSNHMETKTQINPTAIAGSSPAPCSPSSESPGTLRVGEPHPAARAALSYVANLPYWRQSQIMESFSSCAIDGNRFAEVCGETLRRVMTGEPVSDRYILGLAWAVQGMSP